MSSAPTAASAARHGSADPRARHVVSGAADICCYLSAAVPPENVHEAHVLAAEHCLACSDRFHNNLWWD